MLLTNHHTIELIQLSISGNRNAQGEIYKRYYKAMYNVSRRIVNDEMEAEDIMQESFLKAFRKLHTLKDQNTFGAWLKRIVINNSVQFLKDAKKENVKSIENELYRLEDDSNDGISTDETNSKVKFILKQIDQLKENYKLALTLHLIEGYDYDEICEIMEISYANCRTMISRAKESLRNKLQPSLNS
ncbi:RNA polymerase sigma factor [Aegicerativicinus sediminis]|uniref:RNA polymerase sigma factor n=1 Tax=Aegicerativicinus sediminis TaxID=2893202 RepID=UPI001E4CCD44|nr:RNA polymerase sigma factor [Aegicerativicinus sediminis]